MSQNKKPIEDRYTEAQDNFVAGRLEHQKLLALRCREVRECIIANPGITTSTLKKKCKATNQEIDWLLERDFIHYDSMFGLAVTPIGSQKEEE